VCQRKASKDKRVEAVPEIVVLQTTMVVEDLCAPILKTSDEKKKKIIM